MVSLEEVASKAVQDGGIPGCVCVAADRSGKFSYSKAFGKTSVDKDAKDTTVDTVFQIASMTKLMTSIAALQVVERGLIGLDDDVSSVIPELIEQGVLVESDGTNHKIDKVKNTMTLRLLLTHSAGLTYDAWNPTMAAYRASKGVTPGTGPTMDTNYKYPLLYQPGEFWTYSPAIDWAGRVVEKLTGETLETYMQKNIWAPLGIKEITFWIDEHPEMKAKLASLTARNPANGSLVPFNQPFINTGKKDCFGGQGAQATIPEYVKILHSILVDDEKLLKKETTAQMFQPQLGPAAKAGLKKLMNMPEVLGMFPGVYPLDSEYDWGLGGLLIETAGKNSRKKNTLVWSGMPNLFWFIDREAGLCGAFGTQVLPPGDRAVAKVITAFEEAMNEKVVSAKL